MYMYSKSTNMLQLTTIPSYNFTKRKKNELLNAKEESDVNTPLN